MIDFKNKKILFISVSFFGYHVTIADKLRNMGAQVDYYDERPSNSFIVKALIRINRNLLGGYIKRYFRKIIQNSEGNTYDYVFFIKGEVVNSEILSILKEHNPSAKFILYLYDSIKNNRNANKIYSLFDTVFSFDYQDCLERSFHFLPLFYDDIYGTIHPKQTQILKMLFVGTIHSDRYRILQDIKKGLEKQNCILDFYMYLQGKLMYYKYFISDSAFRNSKKDDFKYTILNKNELLSRMIDTDVIIDIQHPNQMGLTMRTLESMGASRKLITTNEDIYKYDFYKPENILIVSRSNIRIEKEFLETPYILLEEEVRKKYALSSWIVSIFDSLNDQVNYRIC